MAPGVPLGTGLQLAPFQTVHRLNQQLGTDLPEALIQLARCLIRTNRNGSLHENITCVDTRIEQKCRDACCVSPLMMDQMMGAAPR